MVTVWRIVKRRHAAAAFVGEGARLYGGRWSSPGVSAVYASETRALALLEVLAGLGNTAGLDAYVLIPAHFPESLVTAVNLGTLPEGWDTYPPPSAAQGVGNQWIKEGASAVLKVPSVLVPGEWNHVLNPCHPDFSAVRIGPPEPLLLDPRLLG